MVPYDPRVFVPEEEEGIDLREYWRILAKRKWVILALVAIAVTASFMATRLQVPEYRATVTVQIDPEGSQILSFQDFNRSGRWYVSEFLASQNEILRSRSLAEAVVRREGLQDHPELTGGVRQRSLVGELRDLARMLVAAVRPTEENVPAPEAAAPEPRGEGPAAGALRSRLEVVPVRNSLLVRISFVSFDPQFAARIANAVAREYMENSMQRRLDAGAEARAFLEKQLDDMRIAIERSDRALADFARQGGVADLEANLEMARAGLRSLNDRFEEVQQELVQIAAWRELVDAGRTEHLDPVLNSATIADLQSRLLDANAEYASLSERFLDSYPTVAETLRRIALLRAEISAERTKVVNGIIGRYDNLKAQEAALQQAIAEREERVMTLNERGVQYNILRREFETSRELYDGLLQRLKEIGVAAGVQEANISVIDTAQVPGAPFRPDLRKNVSIAGMVGLAVGIALALLLEFLDSTIRRTEDVERLVDRPVLGLVPLMRLRDRRKAGETAGRHDREVAHFSANHPKSSISEAFRSLRTSLMFSTPEGMPKALLVTSSAQGEGKTTTAANLATVLAQNGARVLLIDADLRRPSLHKDFGIARAPGLTNCIAHNGPGPLMELSLVKRTEVEGLSVMPAGHSTPSPAELLSSSRLAKILTDLRQIFDHVIVDAPPILGLADAVILSRMVDGVILVAASGRTGKENFRVSVRRLYQVQAPLLGVVLNQVDLASPDYAYYSSYYYNYETDRDRLEHETHGLSKAS
jgi:polysaccharide biosynthesis transport protein